jgi:choline kinase
MVTDVTWLCLAAGQGTRLRPITDEKPKAMVTVEDRPLVDWLTETARQVGIDDIALVSGYRGEMLADHTEGVRIYDNPDYNNTDMVHSLWCAEEALDGPVVISYSDILYTPAVLKRVAESPHNIAVAVDDEWQSYWDWRHENPTEDAESLELASDGRIRSIGQPVNSMAAPDAQYVGLVKLSPEGVERFREVYQEARESVERSVGAEGRSFEKLHITDLLQRVIDRGDKVQAERIQGEWVEIDTPRDLDIARIVCRDAGDGTLNIDRTKSNDESIIQE